MPFDSQFSLSLEVTRLLPLSLITIGKTYEAAMSLARDLQVSWVPVPTRWKGNEQIRTLAEESMVNADHMKIATQSSGSDIVVEEDLAEIFGRLTITPNLAASFRNVLSRPVPPSHLVEKLSLYAGSGPTILRAMKEAPYFSTVLQCSFLVHLHEKESLAAALQQYFELRDEGAPKDAIPRATPALESVRGTLQAIEDQTAMFDWSQFLTSAAAAMGISATGSRAYIDEAMPVVVLQGLISMLPLVQRFPEEHLICIESQAGIVAVVVWAHVVLGLSVRVKFYSSDNVCSETIFGSEPEQLLVDTKCYLPTLPDNDPWPFAPSVTLLSASTQEQLFRLKAEHDAEKIDATFKAPAKGFARRLLERSVQVLQRPEVAARELELVCCAFALCMAKWLVIAPPGTKYQIATAEGDDWLKNAAEYGNLEAAEALYAQFDNTHDTDEDDDQSVDVEPTPYEIPEGRILEAASMLMDSKKLDRKIIAEYAAKYSNTPLALIPEPPVTITACLRAGLGETQSTTAMWPELCLNARHLAVVILAFAHVPDLATAAGLPLCERLSLLAPADLCMTASAWDGKSCIMLREDVWLEVIGLLMTGHLGTNLDLQTTSLLSNRGWSIFVSTFGDADPMHTDPGFVIIRPGVPWRNGVWKHRIVDGPDQGKGHLRWHLEQGHGSTALLKCAANVDLANPLVGERGDSFVVSLRFRVTESLAGTSMRNSIRRSGYNELWSALWIVNKSKPCEHPCRLGDSIVLEPGWSVASGFGDHGAMVSLGRIIICQTAASPAARWRALISIFGCRDMNRSQVLLRGDDCCLTCVVQQAAIQEGNWYVVL